MDDRAKLDSHGGCANGPLFGFWGPVDAARGLGLHPHTADDLQGALRRGLPTPCSARTGLQRHVRPSGRPQAQAYETTHVRTGCDLSYRTLAVLAGLTSRKGLLLTLRAAEAIRGDSSSLGFVDAVLLSADEFP